MTDVDGREEAEQRRLVMQWAATRDIAAQLQVHDWTSNNTPAACTRGDTHKAVQLAHTMGLKILIVSQWDALATARVPHWQGRGC